MDGKKITDLFEEIAEEICDKYCKYTDAYGEEDQDFLYEKICAECPLVTKF